MINKNKIKIGFIGHGRHAGNNLYPSLKLLGLNIHSISTTSKKSADKAKLDQGASNSYSNYKNMLKKENLDCVFISTPPEQHVELTIDCLNSGSHVFVEKNLGYNQKEAQAVAGVSKKTKKHVMVGFMKRYAPAYQKMYEIIKTKEFGEIISVSGMFGVRNFVTNSKEFLLFAAIHYVDMLTSIIGEVKELEGHESNVKGSISQVFTCVGETGITASMAFYGSPSWSKLNEELYVTGVNGYTHIENVEKLSYHINAPKSEKPRWQIMDEEETVVSTVSTTSSGGYKDLYQRGFVPEIEHFIDCVSKNKEPLTSAFENAKTMKMSDFILSNLKSLP